MARQFKCTGWYEDISPPHIFHDPCGWEGNEANLRYDHIPNVGAVEGCPSCGGDADILTVKKEIEDEIHA